MGFQKQIFNTLAAGIEGEYADDSARRDTAYTLLANVTAQGAQAEGSLTFSANPSNNDTVTVGAYVYTFKTAAVNNNDVAIGAALADTLASLAEKINAQGGITADVSGSAVTITADEAGTAGNSIALASSSDNVTVSAMAGGADEAANLPHFGYAFTHTENDGQVQLGGTGIFAGILVNPKMYVNYQDLKANMTLPSGSQGSLCTFGHVYVKSNTAYQIGSIAAYNNTTGRISAYAAAADVPAGSTVIAGAKFIKHSGASDVCGILELNN